MDQSYPSPPSPIIKARRRISRWYDAEELVVGMIRQTVLYLFDANLDSCLLRRVMIRVYWLHLVEIKLVFQKTMTRSI
jgi:hypothetical protein